MRFWKAPLLPAMIGGIAMLVATPRVAAGQTAETAAPVVEQAESPKAPQPMRLYVGMWTLHLKDPAYKLDNNWLVGITWRGYFVGTFLNSYGKRAYTAGIQRPIVQDGSGAMQSMLGFRVGAISGYDGRFMKIARETPVLPIVSAFGMVEYQRIGIEVSYTFVIVSAAVTYRF
jgi:hypothetical protein